MFVLLIRFCEHVIPWWVIVLLIFSFDLNLLRGHIFVVVAFLKISGLRGSIGLHSAMSGRGNIVYNVKTSVIVTKISIKASQRFWLSVSITYVLTISKFRGLPLHNELTESSPVWKVGTLIHQNYVWRITKNKH